MFETPAVLAILYFTASVLFAVIYFSMWRLNPDAFIVHQEMNLRPLSMWPVLRTAGKKNRQNRSAVVAAAPLETIYDQCSKLNQLEIELSTQLEDLELQIIQAKQEVDSVSAKHNEEMVANMKVFLEQQQRTTSEGIAQALESLKQRSATHSADAQLDQLEKETAAEIKRAVNGEKASVNLADFAKTSVVNEFENAFARRDQLMNQQLELSEKRLKVQRDQRGLLESWEAQRVSRLGFVDFIYFSMGVATSNTFGDMIPNDRAIRFMIVVQLIVSVVLVGLFVNAITRR
jgi:hypothetical protein